MQVKSALYTTAFGFLLLSSCSKDIRENYDLTDRSVNAQTKLSYGSNAFSASNLGAQYITPVSKPEIGGYYKAVPLGLIIDQKTGRIDLSRSEAGTMYKVFYIAHGASKALDSVSLMVSGVDYRDAIYNASSDAVVPAIYRGDNGTVRQPDVRIQYDITDLDGDGSADLMSARQKNLVIDGSTGRIDLKASLKAGFFGSTTPADGTEKIAPVYYKVSDASGSYINKIVVRVKVYHSASAVPASEKSLIANRNDMLNTRFNSLGSPVMLAKNSTAPATTTTTTTTTTTSTSSTSTSLLEINTLQKDARPPLIILVTGGE